MARKYKVKRTSKSRFGQIFPDPVQTFVARRIIDITGIAFLLAGLCVTLALISYNPSDPSMNSAGDGSVYNWLGRPGSYMADALIQSIGLGGFLLGLSLFMWGYKVLSRNSLSPFWLRFSTAIFAAFAAGAAFAHTSPGGDVLGMKIMQGTADLIHSDSSHVIAATIWGLIAVALQCVAFSIGFSEIKWVCALVINIVMAAGYFLYDSAVNFVGWIKHYTDADYVAEDRPKRRRSLLPERDEDDDDEEIVMESSDEDDEEEEEEEEEESDEGEEEEGDEDEEYDEDDEDEEPSRLRVVKSKQSSKKSAGGRQKKFQLFDGGEWELPGIDLLQEPDEDQVALKVDEKVLKMNAELLQNVLQDFNVKGEITNIHPGPVVTLYELEPAPGTKTSRVIGLADDIARSMSAVSVRAAVVPGRNVIGIELPNKKRQMVILRDMLSTRDYEKNQARLPLVLGKDIGGAPIIADLARMPHLLVAGTTGSGKSVAINTMILSLLYRLPPEKCRFIMIDPKMLELSVYDDIPHLLSPVVTEPGKAVVALKWVVNEMEDRYRAMSKLGVRNIDGYNARLAEARKKGEVLMRKVQTGFDPETGKPVYEEQPLDLTDLPYIVVIVDEFADLMLVAGKDVESAIQRLAQMARAAGIHLIMATQRPSVDVITGVIKANFPTRISFAVTSKIDSRTILGEGGAEQLLGQGDMLYMASGGRITRVHGPFASDADVENVVSFLKSQAEPSYIEDITEGGFEGEDGEGEEGEACDELYDEAVALVAREQKASTSFIQRHLQIGYNRAARIIEEMERQQVIGKANHVGKREVLVGQR